MAEIGSDLKQSTGGVRLRAIFLGLLLVPVNALWVVHAEVIRPCSYPSLLSLFPNVIFILVLLTLLNALVKLALPKAALRPGELLVTYVTLCMSTAMCSHDVLQGIMGAITGAFYYHTPENSWAELLQPHLSRWFTVSNDAALTGFFEGGTSLYKDDNWRAWTVPVAMWSGLLVAMVFVMICINTIVRKEWLEYERLTFPIVTVPLEITTNSKSLVRNSLFWTGFGIASTLCIMSGLHSIWDNFYALTTTPWWIGHIVQHPPWNAMGGLVIAFYPSIIGISFLMPADLQFSCWFFFWVWKLENVVLAWLGWRPMLPEAYQRRQATGGYIGLAVIALWASRGHLKRVVQKAMGNEAAADDSNEPMPYWLALTGLLLGMSALVVLSYFANMPAWLAVIFFLFYFAISTAIARMRATAGTAAQDLRFTGPDIVIPEVGGTENFSPKTMGAFALFYGFNRGYRALASAHSIEGFRIAERAGIRNRKMLVIQVLAVIVAVLTAFWAVLHLGYAKGLPTGNSLLWLAREPFGTMAGRLTNPKSIDYGGTTFMGVGFAIVMLLRLAQTYILRFPFHPIGFAVSVGWMMELNWFPIFLAWLCKASIIKYAGGRVYRKAVPFFVGLVIGEYMFGMMWGLLSIIYDKRFYSFWPWG